MKGKGNIPLPFFGGSDFTFRKKWSIYIYIRKNADAES